MLAKSGNLTHLLLVGQFWPIPTWLFIINLAGITSSSNTARKADLRTNDAFPEIFAGKSSSFARVKSS